jgi:hypothetical protein
LTPRTFGICCLKPRAEGKQVNHNGRGRRTQSMAVLSSKLYFLSYRNERNACHWAIYMYIQLIPDILRFRRPTISFNISEFQYQRNLKHWTISHALFTWKQKCVLRCLIIIMLTILQCLNDELDIINLFKVFIFFFFRSLSFACLINLYMLHNSISRRPTKILSSTFGSICM